MGPQGPTVAMLNKIANACGERLFITTESERAAKRSEEPLVVFAVTSSEADVLLDQSQKVARTPIVTLQYWRPC
jgi:hypothetical protein